MELILWTSTDVVNAGQGLKTIDKKIAWNVAFELYLRQLDTVKPVIWTGDLNVVQTEKGKAFSFPNLLSVRNSNK